MLPIKMRPEMDDWDFERCLIEFCFNISTQSFVTDCDSKIRLIAYNIWEKAGCPWGHEEEFWFIAEQEYIGSLFFPYSSNSEII